jgi:hypothetical protein
MELLEALELELVDGVVETLAVGPWRMPRS